MMESSRLISDSWGLFLLWWWVSYTLGSFLWGPIVVWWFKRKHGEKVSIFYLFRCGSHSPGGTNVGRVAGVGGKGKALTILLDATKGAMVVAGALAFHFPLWAVALSGFLAMIGHAFPFFYLLMGHRGGKAVATSLGVFLVIAPKITLVALLCYVLIALYGKKFRSMPLARFCRMSSVRSLTACLIIASLAVIFDGGYEIKILGFSSLIFITFLHLENIARIRAGTEPEEQKEINDAN
ncbi:MAG: glycerol-3-phosphate acyltransferase [Candidatus Paceibacterota bacterium]|jgi:glycerol-3-phosphate acyltransferase PlsY